MIVPLNTFVTVEQDRYASFGTFLHVAEIPDYID